MRPLGASDFFKGFLAYKNKKIITDQFWDHFFQGDQLTDFFFLMFRANFKDESHFCIFAEKHFDTSKSNN
jgi:hypothetical protein